MNALWQEVEAFKKSISRCIFFFVGVTIFLLSFTLKSQSVFGITFLLPFPGTPSLATELFLATQKLLIPTQVSVVALGPVSVFFAPLLMALLIALLITFPYAIWTLLRFLRPALTPTEWQSIMRVIFPVISLFYIGCALAFFLILPRTFSLLYSFAQPLGVTPLFALDDFISSVFFITITVGISFLFPVVMMVLSQIGLVSSFFWVQHWRGALLSIFLFSAIITPDGSGLTMVFLSIPLSILYGLGVWAARTRNLKLSPVVQKN